MITKKPSHYKKAPLPPIYTKQHSLWGCRHTKNIIMRKLRNVTVLGHKIEIEYKTWHDGQFGSCDPDNRLIKLSHACLDDDELHWATLSHEVMHMIFHMAGISFMEVNSEEAYVRCIESLILPWIEANKPPIPKARKR